MPISGRPIWQICRQLINNFEHRLRQTETDTTKTHQKCFNRLPLFNLPQYCCLVSPSRLIEYIKDTAEKGSNENRITAYVLKIKSKWTSS